MPEPYFHLIYKDTSLFVKKTNNLKALVLIHGGKASKEAAKAMCEEYTIFSAEYSLISVDYRFSGYGGEELEDVINAIRYARFLSIPKIFLIGESHGGYLALLAAAKEEVNGVIDAYGPTDLLAMQEYVKKENNPLEIEWQDYIEATLKECIKGGADIITCAKKRSPCFLVAKLKAPLLVLHGSEDETVPLSQSEKLVEGLKHMRKKNFKFVVLAGYAHGFSLLEGKLYYIIKDFLGSLK
jgi:dipeptidyl aminopeptidase/acylaminoacyl peptidase